MVDLVSVGLARSVWVVDAAELNPRGRNLFTDLVPAIVNQFHFQTFPQQGGDFSQGLKFTRGVFRNRELQTIDVDVFTIWSDGLVADTRSSTLDSDDLLEEGLKMLPALGFAFDPLMVHRKSYNSQLHVQCPRHLRTLNPKLDQLAAKLSSVVGGGIAFEFAGLELWPDQSLAIKPATFIFQRRLNDPRPDHYWSQAPLSTEKHIVFLQELEALLA